MGIRFSIAVAVETERLGLESAALLEYRYSGEGGNPPVMLASNSFRCSYGRIHINGLRDIQHCLIP